MIFQIYLEREAQMVKRVNQQRECFSCKKAFGPKHTSQVYCSYDCAAASGRLDKVCELCGSTYLPPRMQWKGKYCSNKCATVAQGHRGPTEWSAARRSAEILRQCGTCNTEYTTPYPNKKYCSRKCQIAAAKQRAEERGNPKRYSLTAKEHEEWVKTRNAILKDQKNKCAICDVFFEPHKRVNLDHSHSTGKIRGVLCTQCNHALGLVKDNVTILKAAIAYLENHE
jgi:hypothetical protein